MFAKIRDHVWAMKLSSHHGMGHPRIPRNCITRTGNESKSFKCGFHSFSRYSSQVIYRGTSTILKENSSLSVQMLPVFGG